MESSDNDIFVDKMVTKIVFSLNVGGLDTFVWKCNQSPLVLVHHQIHVEYLENYWLS